jgi:hypothetical protein
MSGSNSHSSSSGASSSNTTGNTFKDFEKKTFDAWDIDEESSTYNLNSLNLKYSIPIPSLLDSEEMAKNVIKNHKESQNQKKLSETNKSIESSPPTAQVPITAPICQDLSKKQGNGPGKALRQGNSHDSFYAQPLPELTSSLKSTSISSKSYQNQANSLSSSNSVKTLVTQSIAKNSIVTCLSSSSNEIKTDSTLNPSKNGNFNYMKSEELNKCEKFKKILSANPINLEELQAASWKGIPKSYRPICWKLLSDYLPLKKEQQDKTIEQKRNSYWESVNEHYSSVYLDSHHEMLRQILNDIPRMNPLIPIFQKKIVQNIFQRVLYVWAVRHPASGYVQGINDLMTPFFVVFLTEYSDPNLEVQNIDIENMPEKDLRQVEADSYWCMTKLLERIQENYVFSQPGIQKNIQSLEDLIKRIDNNLYQHLRKNNIEFIQFAFRWMNNLLMRELPLACTIRLWDTYHGEPFGFSDFHLYVCAAFLLRYSKNLMEESDFQDLMLFLQNLPTRNLKPSEMALLTAEAYKLQVMFANSPNHTATIH